MQPSPQRQRRQPPSSRAAEQRAQRHSCPEPGAGPPPAWPHQAPWPEARAAWRDPPTRPMSFLSFRSTLAAFISLHGALCLSTPRVDFFFMKVECSRAA
eukprot:scaffold13056_cov101-Isochrysis_galbana.AAC.1